MIWDKLTVQFMKRVQPIGELPKKVQYAIFCVSGLATAVTLIIMACSFYFDLGSFSIIGLPILFMLYVLVISGLYFLFTFKIYSAIFHIGLVTLIIGIMLGLVRLLD
jgi:hypothetical protein